MLAEELGLFRLNLSGLAIPQKRTLSAADISDTNKMNPASFTSSMRSKFPNLPRLKKNINPSKYNAGPAAKPSTKKSIIDVLQKRTIK